MAHTGEVACTYVGLNEPASSTGNERRRKGDGAAEKSEVLSGVQKRNGPLSREE
jgi:hypothetical protein